MRVLAILFLLAATAAAEPWRCRPGDRVGPYAGWAFTGWLPPAGALDDRLGAENGLQHRLWLGMRIERVALEAWWAPAESAGLGAHGVDLKLLQPLGRWAAAYARARLGAMAIDLPDHMTASVREPAVELRGTGGGFGIGFQAQLRGSPLHLLLPFLIAAPVARRGTGGLFIELGREYYILRGGALAFGERFFVWSWGYAWGGAF